MAARIFCESLIDWSIMEEELFKNQKEIAQAAYLRDWPEVRRLQDKLVSSYAAKTLAVRDVADVNSAAGVDGVKFTSDSQKMRAAMSLVSQGYTPKPNRYTLERPRRLSSMSGMQEHRALTGHAWKRKNDCPR